MFLSTWSHQGGDLCHLVYSLLFLHPGVEESLSLASCPSPSCPTAFSLCPLTALLAHRRIHIYSELQVSRATDHRGNHITFVDTEGGRGTGEGTCLVLSTCLSLHGHRPPNQSHVDLKPRPSLFFIYLSNYGPGGLSLLLSDPGILVGGPPSCIPKPHNLLPNPSQNTYVAP